MYALSVRNRDRNQLDYIQKAFSQFEKEPSSKPISSGTCEVVPPPVSELLQSTKEEPPQPGPSRSSQFCAVKAVLPTYDDELIKVWFCVC